MELYEIKDRASWLTLRKRDVTASEIAGLFGVSKWSSPLQVYADKTGGAREFGDNAAMKAGRIMESAIAEAVRELHSDWIVEKATKYYRDPELRIGCTPDYFKVVGVGMGSVKVPVECKFVQPKIYEADWKDGPPLMYVLQTLVQIYITGAPYGYVAVMLDNRAKDVFLYDVPRNDAAWAKIKERVKMFWIDVALGVLPGADYTKDGAALKELYPADAYERPLDLRGDNRLPEILSRRENIKEAVKVMQKTKEEPVL